jgi:hypothetical protein
MEERTELPTEETGRNGEDRAAEEEGGRVDERTIQMLTKKGG